VLRTGRSVDDKQKEIGQRLLTAHTRVYTILNYRVAQNSKPLPNDKKILLNHIIACQ